MPEAELAEEVSLKPFRRVLKKTVLFGNGSYAGDNVCGDREREGNWRGVVESGHVDGVVFGRAFITNPDLVERLRHGWPLNGWDPRLFYGPGEKGYTDYGEYQGEGEGDENGKVVMAGKI